MAKRLWQIEAHISDGAGRSILAGFGYNPEAGWFHQTGKGVSSQEWSDGVPEWMLQLKAELDRRGDYCVIRG